MKKTRKEALIYCFPAVDKELMDKMKGRGAKNYVVFLTRRLSFLHVAFTDTQRVTLWKDSGMCSPVTDL